jgi:hypothetical protein
MYSPANVSCSSGISDSIVKLLANVVTLSSPIHFTLQGSRLELVVGDMEGVIAGEKLVVGLKVG